ncbi:MAG: hypothetical protein ABJN36_09535 [Cyclobacteriaceae bacterium]
MKSILTVWLLILTFITHGQTDDRISKFEKALGEEESKALNTIVLEFDKFLQEVMNYQDVVDSRQTYVELFAYGKPWFDFSDERFIKLSRLNMKSGLKSALGHYPDTVWIADDSVYYIYDYHLNPDTTIFSFAFYKKSDRDLRDIQLSNLSPEELETLTQRFYSYGNFDFTDKYFQALNQVKDDSDFLLEYCEALLEVGDVPLSLSSYGLLNSSPDFSDYFIQRIIVVEYFIPMLPTRISMN